MSWAHGQPSSPISIPGSTPSSPPLSPAIAIAFTGNPGTVDVTSIDAVNVFQVWAVLSTETTKLPYLLWVQLLGNIVYIDATVSGKSITSATQTSAANANGVAFVFDPAPTENIQYIRVRLLGDFVFVMDTSASPPKREDRVISAEFVRADLPSGEIPANGNYGLEGGTFESWFTPENFVAPQG